MIVQRTVSFCLSSAFLFLTLESQPALGQQSWLEAATQVNNSTITIVGGDIHSNSARMTQDLALLLNDGEQRRVLPVLGLDSVSSVSDVLHLKGVDIGIVHEDSLNAIGQHKIFPNVAHSGASGHLFRWHPATHSGVSGHLGSAPLGNVVDVSVWPFRQARSRPSR